MILCLALDLPEDASYVTMTRQLGRTALQYLNVSPVDIGDAETILDELTSNAVRHAKSHDGRFRVTLDYYADRIAITVEENGPGFRPDAVPPPGTARPDLDGGERLGGFGLKIVQALTDRLELRSEGDGWTKVQAEKRLTYQTAEDAHRGEDMSDGGATATVAYGEKGSAHETENPVSAARPGIGYDGYTLLGRRTAKKTAIAGHRRGGSVGTGRITCARDPARSAAMTSTIRPMTAARLICSFRTPLTCVALSAASLFAQPFTEHTMAQTPHPATAAPADKMVAIPTPAQPDAIDLGTGPLPGAATPESWHSQYGSVFARNVSVATLRPFLPEPSKASGAAVIVAPGGGFQTLSMENEGWHVARALADRGVAAFVLKYRLNQTPADLDTFAHPLAPRPAGTPAGAAPAARPSPGDMASRIAPQIADANAAFALVRANAAKCHVDPDRIGMIGFSAGGMLTMATTLQGHGAKPAFIGNIYGGLSAVDVPPDAPPLFAAVAADDPLLGAPDFGLIENWRKAHRPVEFHYYEQGGHGFGMYPKETTSTGWFDAFVKWLGMHGELKPKA